MSVPILKAIEHLRHFQDRKRMYVRTVDVSNVESFLGGFRIACFASGSIRDMGQWHDAIDRRGWLEGAMAPADVMRERGLDDEAIMDELVEIEIEALRIAAEEYR